MLSDEYEQTLRVVHEGRPAGKAWGTTGRRNFGEYVRKYIDDHNGWITSVLDFGCGQGTLGEYLRAESHVYRSGRLDIFEYDPGVSRFSDRKALRRCDLVVSSDVLEHVEPEYVSGTLDQLSELARRAQYHHIACEPCGLILPDGRNAHLSVHAPEVWKMWIAVAPWKLQYYADRLERKRGELRRSCHILVEK